MPPRYDRYEDPRPSPSQYHTDVITVMWVVFGIIYLICKLLGY